jgi:hypothetical protein
MFNSLGSKMAFSVHLNDKTEFLAIEIRNVEADKMLPSKFHSELLSSQLLPQEVF